MRAPVAPIGMAEGDRAAVHVDPRQVEREVPRAGDDLRGEGLVQLDQVDVRERAARSSASSARIAGTGRCPSAPDRRPPTSTRPRARAARRRTSRPPPRSPSTSAAAPSVMPEELPACTVPFSGSKTGGSFASDASVVSGRGCSSAATTDVALPARDRRPERSRRRSGPRRSPRRRAAATRPRRRPARRAGSRTRGRGSPRSRPSAGRRAGRGSRPGTSRRRPPRCPSACRSAPAAAGTASPTCTRCRPARTTSFSPAAIVSAPRVIALSDEAQALLTVKAGTESGTPARCETWRAVFGPPPACRAWPKIVSSTAAGGRPDRSIAALRRGLAEIGGRQRREGAAELADRGAGRGEDEDGAHGAGIIASRSGAAVACASDARRSRLRTQRGRRTVNVIPSRPCSRPSTLPLCASTIQRTIERPEPRAARVGAARALAAEEPLEDEGQVRLRDPDAGVGDRRSGPRPARRRRATTDPAARLGVPQRVLDEVVQHLLEASGVGEDVDRAAPGTSVESSSSRSAGGGREIAHGLGDEPPEVQVGEGERHAPALAARQEEQVLRDPREVADLEDRVADRLAVLLRRPLLLERHLERAAEHGQRRAQLVRDVGDELLLLLLGRGERVEPRVQELGDRARVRREVRPPGSRRSGCALGRLEPLREDLELRGRPSGLGRRREPKSRPKTPLMRPPARQAAGPAPGSRTR